MEAQKRSIRAIIPTNETPQRVVVLKGGDLPTREHIAGSGHTFEGTLSLIARDAIGRALSVNEAIYTGIPDETTYLTKAIPANTNLRTGYEFLDTTPQELVKRLTQPASNEAAEQQHRPTLQRADIDQGTAEAGSHEH